jgi:hypothetical protein
MRHTIPLVLGGLIAAATAVPAGAESIDREFHKTFTVRPGMVLHLDHGDGHVRIDAVDGDRLTVDIVYRAEHTQVGLGGDVDFEADLEEHGNEIRVAGRVTGPGGFFGIHAIDTHEYSYRIGAPGHLALELRGDDGNVEITGGSAGIDCETDDGDVTLRDIDGTVRVFTEDGDLLLDGVRGDLHLETDDGDIEGAGVASPRIVVRTEDGDVGLDLLDVPGVDWRFSSDDGRIELEIGGNISAELTVRTDDGRIRVDVPGAEIRTDDENRLTARLGDGDGRIRIDSNDGSVSVHRRFR